ncbi:hypothetical protein Desti_0875 [Desulfomonile tiedjei DSM 6799]|uniref:Uncharacterized protein n=1 Tax=Desulfomonile tiedjei (strain ATCC 49306 / DSM 6799 / DCB-1) TaxID=706587 RepID=I4C206_DESTA|nr:hypothetical protein Desti_0875 [Desulfomonile tiedjei DSM 6799]
MLLAQCKISKCVGRTLCLQDFYFNAAFVLRSNILHSRNRILARDAVRSL